MKNRQIKLTEIPRGPLEESHFQLNEADRPTPDDGEILVRTKLISLDAANRAWMQGATYREAVKVGDVMHAYVIGEVAESRSDKFQVGDLIQGEGCWADFFTTKATRVLKLSDHQPTSHLLSVLGIAGKTAYYGLLNVGRPKEGETVLVSAAAGSVGIYVGQIAKIKGCRAVGIAGGPEKCQWLVDELNFDAAVDYKGASFAKDLKAACPDGVDVYFDNVGGKILEVALFLMNMRGRIVCCGAVSQYDTGSPSGPRNLPGMLVVKRLRMEGFIAMDYPEQEKQAAADLQGWVDDGKIKVVEDIVDGLENAPTALIGLLHGENRGKRMVRVTAD